MRVRHTHLLLLLWGVLLVPSVGGAQELDRLHFTIGEHALVSLPGRVEVVGGYADGLSVEAADPELAQSLPADLSLTTRLRMAPGLLLVGESWPLFTAYQLSTDFDIRYAMGTSEPQELLAFSPIHQAREALPLPRLLEARAAAMGDYLALSFGLMRSYWGMGMLSNDGRARDQAGASPFGYARTSDRVVRAQVAVFPLGPASEAEERAAGRALEPPLTLAFGADAVIEDDTADWLHGDRTWHAVAAVRGRYAGFNGGLYGVHRIQSHAEGGETEVTVIDLYARQEMTSPEVNLWVEAELALTFGETTYAENPLHPGPQEVLAGGGLARVGFESGVFGMLLEAGYASGDDNPYDTEQRAFTFDREHRVGLLMFREALRKASAVSAYNIADPTYRASPPRGYERTATQGAIRGAVYVNPRATIEIAEGLKAMVGYVHARSDGPYADPFQSGLMGGASVGLRGALLADHFGDELNLGLDYTLALDVVSLRFRGEFAWFKPGDIFSDPDEGTAPADQLGGWLHGVVRW